MASEHDHMDIDSGTCDGATFTRTMAYWWISELLTNSLDSEQQKVEETTKPKSKQKFEVKKWTAVAFWSWGMYELGIRSIGLSDFRLQSATLR